MHITEQIIQWALELKPQEKLLVIGSLMNSIDHDEKNEPQRDERYEKKFLIMKRE
ncbi:MAG: hypothetical protein JXQ65_16195 [Candidatus Marinimicrobia bacterium]|nr:hypothetical protein [Candidatus Neomarinimicrobiota bacterium]